MDDEGLKSLYTNFGFLFSLRNQKRTVSLKSKKKKKRYKQNMETKIWVDLINIYRRKPIKKTLYTDLDEQLCGRISRIGGTKCILCASKTQRT